MLLRYVLLFLFALALKPQSIVASPLQTDSAQTTWVEHLEYMPLAGEPGLAKAEDMQGNTWVRGTIPSGLVGKDIVLQNTIAHVQDYRLFVQQEGSLTEIAKDQDKGGQPIRGRFPQYVFAGEGEYFYLQCADYSQEMLHVQLQEQHSFTREEGSRMFRIGIYYGLALMSMVFNYVFYLVFKDKRFTTYGLLLLSVFLTFMYEDGMFYYFSGGSWELKYFTAWNCSITAILALCFTYFFLGLDSVMKRYIRGYYFASALLLSGALLYTLTDSQIIFHSVLLGCFLFVLPCFYLALRRFKKDVYARFLLFAFSAVVLTGVFYVGYAYISPQTYTWFDINTFRLVSSIEIISISFAIIFKVRALQEENERYRSELQEFLTQFKQQEAELQERRIPFVEPETQANKKAWLQDLENTYGLTEREMEVLLCIWEGMTNKEIANKFFISLSTVKYHVGNLYVKLDVKNRNQVQVLKNTLPHLAY